MLLERLLAGTGWRVAEPAVLLGLLTLVLAAAVAGAVGIARRRGALRRGFGRLGPRVAPGATPGWPIARLALSCAGLALLALAAARPQAVLRTEQVPVRGVDLVVVLDASRSMLARDAAPDRLTRARRDVASLLDRVPGLRVALVVFAGTAHLRAPLTSDVHAAKLILAAVEPQDLPVQGTDLAKALDVAGRALAPADGARAALLVGDGEDHGGGAAEAAERLSLAGIPLFTAAVGTASGAPVPAAEGGAVRDRAGRVVLSRLDEERLAELAARGGGKHVRLDGGGGVAELAAALSRLERRAPRTARVRAWDERFDRFALPALLLLAAAAALPERSPTRRRARSGRAAPLAAGAAFAVLLTGAAPFLAEHEGLAEANALAARDPEAALRLIDAVEREVGPRAEIDVDRGIALFRAGRIAEARRSFSLSARAPGPLASRSVYAEGVAALAEGDEAAALAAWRRALVLDPANGAARFNLEVLLRRASRAEASGPVESSRGSTSRSRDRDPEEREPTAERTAEPRSGEASGPTAEPRSGEAPGPVESPRGSEPRSSDRDTAERDRTAERAASPRSTESSGTDPSPMSVADAERLLDEVAAGERAMPLTPSRGLRVAPEKTW
jgi:Ca-activated chloride channel family protein